MNVNADTFPTPYYAVIFSSVRSGEDPSGYEKSAERMLALAERQPGFLGIESVRGEDGFGITVSYWKTFEDIRAWKANAEHRAVQEKGRSAWYASFTTRVCKVERDNAFDAG